MEEKLVAVGRVIGAHGIRGELKVRFYNHATTLPEHLGRLLLRDPGGQLSEHQIAALRSMNRDWIMRLAGMPDRTAAEEHRACELVVKESWLPELTADEFYVHQLIGMRARHMDGPCLGEVAEVFSNGANDVLVLRNGERELLIPFVDEVVVRVDLGGRELVIDPPDGLLDQ